MTDNTKPHHGLLIEHDSSDTYFKDLCEEFADIWEDEDAPATFDASDYENPTTHKHKWVLLDGAFVAGDPQKLFYDDLIAHLAPRDDTVRGRALCGTLILDETMARYRIYEIGGAKDEPNDHIERAIARWIVNGQPVVTSTNDDTNADASRPSADRNRTHTARRSDPIPTGTATAFCSARTPGLSTSARGAIAS